MLDSDEINKERISEVSVGEVAIGKEGAVGSKGGQRSRRHQGRSNGGRNGQSFGRQNNRHQQFGTIFASNIKELVSLFLQRETSTSTFEAALLSLQPR